MAAFVTAIPLRLTAAPPLPPSSVSVRRRRAPLSRAAPSRPPNAVKDAEHALPPSTPAEWLRSKEAPLPSCNTDIRLRSSPADVAHPSQPPLPTGLLYLAGSARWLYASPPSYCNVVTKVDELVAALQMKTFYLGPVTRNKVVRAVELALGAVGVPSAQLSDNIAVALIVADLQMDCDTICAAVLRSGVGHPGCTKADVERQVGSDVLRILNFHDQVVDSVKLCCDSSFTEMSFSNLRELILVGAMDEHRAISLELARAVLAIRTIDALPDGDSKLAVARRTMYLYAPLANQLGIWFVQGELEELAFMYLQPESYHMIRRLVGERRRECESTLTQSKEFLERVLTTSPDVRSLVRTVLIKGRVKGLYSVYRKMRRSGKKVFEIYDLLALRVVVQPKRADEESEKAACYAVYNVIKHHFETFESRAKDYISDPKRNGYRSLHMTVLPDGGSTPLEIQIRTERMHHVAEFGAAAHWIYKETSAQEEAVASAAKEKEITRGGSTETKDDGTNCEERIKVKAYIKADAKKDTSTKANKSSLPTTVKIIMKQAAKSESAEAELPSLPARMGMPKLLGRDDVQEQTRKGYVTCLATAIRTSRVIVAAAGQLYGLAIGSTLLDLANGLGLASLGAIAVVNGSVAPLTQRLEMNDIVRFISALPEA